MSNQTARPITADERDQLVSPGGGTCAGAELHERKQRECAPAMNQSGGQPAQSDPSTRRPTIHERIQKRIANVNSTVAEAERYAAHLRTIGAMLPTNPTPEQEEALHQFLSI